MKGIIIKYLYKRYKKWYRWTYVTRTSLLLDNLTLNIIKPEIKKKEQGVEIMILYANYED